MALTKGGVDVMLEKAVNVLTERKLAPLDADEVSRENDRMAGAGPPRPGRGCAPLERSARRSVARARRAGAHAAGAYGMLDPPREEVRQAVALCKSAGIRPVMITGDHPLTALSIARRIGIVEDGGAVMTCRELDRLSLEDFENQVEDIRVYARMIPEQKLKIVRALQDKGQIVAMTGDGVNDAPALNGPTSGSPWASRGPTSPRKPPT